MVPRPISAFRCSIRLMCSLDWSIKSLESERNYSLAFQYLLAIDHLLVGFCLVRVCHDDGNRVFVELRATCSTHHLQNLQIRELFHLTLLKTDCVLDDDHMTRQVDPHSKCGRTTNDAELAGEVGFLNHCSIFRCHACVVKAYSTWNNLCTQRSADAGVTAM